MKPDALLFGKYRLDLARQELLVGTAVVATSPLAFKLIRFLALNRDRTLTGEELLREIWSGVSVADSALHQALKHARRAVGDDGRKQNVIKTVRGLGYRFVAPVREVSSATDFEKVDLASRANELASLEALVDEVPTTGGRAVFLAGEPGVGKTTLLNALERRLRPTGREGEPIVVAGRASAQIGSPPYWIWVGVFRALARIEELTPLRAAIEASVPSLLGSGAGEETLEGRGEDLDEAERFRLFDRVSQALAEVAARRPLVILLDDLHAAGAAAIELLAFLVEALESMPILVVGAYRPREMTEREMQDPMNRIIAGASVEMRVIEPLDSGETSQLLKKRATGDLDERILVRIARQSRGSPFFALELLRFAEEAARKSDSGSTPRASDDEILHWSLARMLEDRLSGLSESARNLAYAAAVVGRPIDLELMREIGAFVPGSEALDELVEKEIVATDVAGEKRPVFAHDLLRESCYADVARRPRHVKEIHLNVAEAYARSGRAKPSQVAFHRVAADPLGDRLETVRALEKAGRVASDSFDEKEARWAFNEALRISDQIPEFDTAHRCEILLAAGENAVRGAFSDEARGHLYGVLREARSVGRWDWFARAALGLAARDEIVGIPEEEVVGILKEAIGCCPADEHVYRARLHSSLALKVRYSVEGLAAARRLISDARAEAAQSADSGATARVLEDASFVEWSVADPEAWIALNHEIVQAATEARDVGLVFRGVKGLATGYLEVGDIAAARREMERCAEIARTAPAPFLRAVVALHDGARAMLAGRWDEGEAHAIRATRWDLPSIAPLAAVQLFCHRLETGRLEELEPAIRSFIASAPGVGAWQFALSRVLVDAGRLDEAQAELAAAGRLGALPRDRNWLTAAVLATESSVALGALDSCRDLYAELRPYRRVNIVMGHGSLCFGSLEHFLGELALALGNPAEARGHWVRALRMHERIGCVPFALKSRWGLLRCARATSTVAGDDSLERVRNEAEALGMRHLAGEIDRKAPNSA